ncbi:hypothetical protein T4B_6015 [Trichinella pseudospiralis]|uniref:Uncharacterized protein n=1 Tax=Trichinella pseudospiralis TaxID=6337 RepID=A0A0V0XKB9_TRIPS|nr:hypothetical protein T4E_5994 [Trichinella pseudospiralis]KRY65707.1 hypothetical protein T4A_2193 [Trichinella pseudospiralis]KRZ18986.1 hypothetical protein T4B_6015 [Trichinella pseudospiralis]KRZ26591.1 hypothetical protein T4C_1610 [Trichinella pseudospiralis]
MTIKEHPAIIFLQEEQEVHPDWQVVQQSISTMNEEIPSATETVSVDNQPRMQRTSFNSPALDQLKRSSLDNGPRADALAIFDGYSFSPTLVFVKAHMVDQGGKNWPRLIGLSPAGIVHWSAGQLNETRFQEPLLTKSEWPGSSSSSGNWAPWTLSLTAFLFQSHPHQWPQHSMLVTNSSILFLNHRC